MSKITMFDPHSAPPPSFLPSVSSTPFWPTPKSHADSYHWDSPPPTGDCPHKAHRSYHVPHLPQCIASTHLTCRGHPPSSGHEKTQQTPPKTPTASHPPPVHHPVPLWCCSAILTGMRPLLGYAHIWWTIPMLTLEMFSMEDATRMVALEDGDGCTWGWGRCM